MEGGVSSTLRFNFRGVDGSEGVFDNGMGEQEDVKAALEYLRDLGKTIRCLAGYSFGSWVNALGLKSLGQIEHVIMISPPVDFAEFEFLGKNTKIKLVVVGDQDDLVSVESIKRFLPKWNPDAELKVIGGANHFYTSKTGELKTVISEFLKGL